MTRVSCGPLGTESPEILLSDEILLMEAILSVLTIATVMLNCVHAASRGRRAV